MNQNQIYDLASGRFLREGRDVLLLGPDKIAIAIAVIGVIIAIASAVLQGGT